MNIFSHTSKSESPSRFHRFDEFVCKRGALVSLQQRQELFLRVVQKPELQTLDSHNEVKIRERLANTLKLAELKCVEDTEFGRSPQRSNTLGRLRSRRLDGNLPRVDLSALELDRD